MTSSAQTPEPTDEQLRVAMDVLGWSQTRSYGDLNEAQQDDVDRVARALAAAVTAEREKVRNLLSVWDALASDIHTTSTSYAIVAAQLREVSL